MIRLPPLPSPQFVTGDALTDKVQKPLYGAKLPEQNFSSANL